MMVDYMNKTESWYQGGKAETGEISKPTTPALLKSVSPDFLMSLTLKLVSRKQNRDISRDWRNLNI